MRKPPLWAQWLLTLLGFCVLTLAVWIAVRAINDAGPSQSERLANQEADRESQIIIEEDQAPRTSALHSAAGARHQLQLAIGADLHERIRQGALSGPVQGVRCLPYAAARSGREPFRCTAQAAGVSYPFLGVVNMRARQLTWCKVDPPPVAGGPQEVAVSPRCRG
ncbi:MAG: hypothetical protein ACRDK2_08095 [Solirubrobacteraceae bacterium]